LVVNVDGLCVRSDPTRFDCAGKFPPSMAGVTRVLVTPGGGWYALDTAGRWMGTQPGFDEVYCDAPSGSDRSELTQFAGATDLALGNWGNCMVRGGKVLCKGFNQMGELGYPTTETCYFMRNTTACSKVPQEVPKITSAVQVLGDQGRCARLADGSVWCWGDFNTRTADGTRYVECYQACNQPPPRRIEGTPPIVQMVHGCGFLGIDAAGQIYMWGELTPPPPNPFAGKRFSNLSGAKKVVAADESCPNSGCALLPSGRVACWGMNYDGTVGVELVDASQAEVTNPTEVPGIPDAIDVAAGRDVRCALRRDRSVWCWGAGAARIGGPGSPATETPAYRPRLVLKAGSARPSGSGGSLTWLFGSARDQSAWAMPCRQKS
jgi:hypothetical protein